MIRCPECGTEVQANWDWCHACGWDPEGLRPVAAHAAAPPGPPPPQPPPGFAAAPPPAAPPGYGYAGTGPGPQAPPGPGYPAYPTTAPPRPPGGGGRSIAFVLLGVGGGAILLVIVLIAAVTFLGTSATSTFETIDGGITQAGGAGVSTTVDIDTDLDAAVWQPFTATDGSFTVDFPGPPVVDDLTPTDDPGIVLMESFSVGLEHTEYYAWHIVLSPDYFFPDPQETIGVGADSMGESLGITFSSRKADTFGYLPALTFTGSVDGGKGTVQGVAFASEQQIFMLLTIANDNVLVDYDRFVDSFVTG